MESFEIAVVVIGLGTAGGKWFEAIGEALVARGSSSALRSSLRAPLEEGARPAQFFAATLLMASVPTGSVRGLGFGWPGGILFLDLADSPWGFLLLAGRSRLPAYEA